MKEIKKVIVNILKKRKERGDKFENQVLALAIKQMDGARDDGWGVFYSKNGKRLVMAKKTIEGAYAVKDDTQEIGDNAFWGCAFLKSVAVPASVTKIGDEAFAHCISLESVCIPSFVEKIGKNPFVDLDSKVVHNQSEAFTIEGKNLYDADRTRLISCLTDASMIIVPKTVRTIGSLAFNRRARLKNVQLPDGLDRIGRDAFSDCDALEEVVIPASVTTIDPYAFASCDNLRKITFLGEVKHLARTSFSDCDNLLSVLVPEGKEKYYRKQLHITSESDTLVLGNNYKPEAVDKAKPEAVDKAKPEDVDKATPKADDKTKPSVSEKKKSEAKAEKSRKQKDNA